jgi:hypothetical protein
MYPAIVKGGGSARDHLRLCAEHFQQLESYCRRYFKEVVYDEPPPLQEELPVCTRCGGALTDQSLVFVTAYPQGQEEIQFYGVVGACCVAKVRKELLLGN